jgi:hypothetical protein
MTDRSPVITGPSLRRSLGQSLEQEQAGVLEIDQATPDRRGCSDRCAVTHECQGALSSDVNCSAESTSRPSFAKTDKRWPRSSPQTCEAWSFRLMNDPLTQFCSRWWDAADSMARLTLSSRGGWIAGT